MTHLVQIEMSLILVLVEITNWCVVQVIWTIKGLEACTSPVSLWLRHADMSMLYSYLKNVQIISKECRVVWKLEESRMII
jgi:hypothetical protein